MRKRKKTDLSRHSSSARRSAAKRQKAAENAHTDAADRKRYYAQHSVMRATKTTQQTTHFLSGPYQSNGNIAMPKSFRKSLLKCIMLTVRLFCRHCLQHPSRWHHCSLELTTTTRRIFWRTSCGIRHSAAYESWMPTFKVQAQVRGRPKNGTKFLYANNFIKY